MRTDGPDEANNRCLQLCECAWKVLFHSPEASNMAQVVGFTRPKLCGFDMPCTEVRDKHEI